MTKSEVLVQLHQKKLSPQKAYRLLYAEPIERKPRRSHFVKLRIITPDSKGVNIFLALLFMLPIPIFLIRFVVKRSKQMTFKGQIDMTPAEMIELVSMRGVSLHVNAQDGTKVRIKTI